MDSQNLQLTDSEPDAACSAEALRELQQRAQAAIAARREHYSRLEADLTLQLDGIAAALAQHEVSDGTNAGQPADSRAEIDKLATELADAQATAQQERAAWESEREALESQRANADADRAAFEAERTAWQTERNELVAKVTGLEAERQSSHVDQESSQDELRGQLADLEQKLSDQCAASVEEQAAWKKEQAQLQGERDELQQKFELALEDVQRFRSRAAELEQDLARRPETDNADSAEVVALRAERDVMSERIKELEVGLVTPLDADAEQQRADLQRRFELAVEDVRELKTKNARLEAQVAGGGQRSSGAGGAADGDMDWESQKRRLLASLEGGDGAEDPVSEKDRASIESTIEITDALVAGKDAEIAELKAQLAAGAVDKSTSAEAERVQAVSAVLDADEVIAQHRMKAEQLEQELEEKLRAAELELSVERANIARNRAELDSLRVELESQRHAQGTVGEQHVAGTPKRRWLSKLGLSGDDET